MKPIGKTDRFLGEQLVRNSHATISIGISAQELRYVAEFFQNEIQTNSTSLLHTKKKIHNGEKITFSVDTTTVFPTDTRKEQKLYTGVTDISRITTKLLLHYAKVIEVRHNSSEENSFFTKVRDAHKQLHFIRLNVHTSERSIYEFVSNYGIGIMLWQSYSGLYVDGTFYKPVPKRGLLHFGRQLKKDAIFQFRNGNTNEIKVPHQPHIEMKVMKEREDEFYTRDFLIYTASFI